MTGPRARDREGGIIDKGGRKTPRAGRLFRPRWQSSPALGGYNSISREVCGAGGSPLVRVAPELEKHQPVRREAGFSSPSRISESLP